MSIDNATQEVVKIIRRYLDEEWRIFLFGSWANGNALETSDIDIGILGKEKVPFGEMIKIKEEIENIPTLRSIDIMDLSLKEKSFRENALKHAKTL